jgi:Flp pilus assembly pilin Flp
VAADDHLQGKLALHAESRTDHLSSWGNTMNVRFWYPNYRAFRRTTAAMLGDRKGTIAIEYGLLAALIAVVILGSIRALGGNLGSLPLGAIVAALS